jgi:hypothetical protein
VHHLLCLLVCKLTRIGPDKYVHVATHRGCSLQVVPSINLTVFSASLCSVHLGRLFHKGTQI